MGFPQIDERLKRPKRAPEPHQTLPAMLDEMADRYELAVALQRTEEGGLSRLSFREWREQAGAAAALDSRGVSLATACCLRRPIIRRGRSRSSAS